jgi:hypothetical protein
MGSFDSAGRNRGELAPSSLPAMRKAAARATTKQDRIRGVRSGRGALKVAEKVYELQGYAIVLEKIAFLTRVFAAEDDEGFQFNIRFSTELRLAPKFPTRHEADLQRSLLLKAINDS